MVQATGLIGTDKAFQIEPFGFTLEMCVKFFRAQVCTAATWIIVSTLIGADKDMSLE